MQPTPVLGPITNPFDFFGVKSYAAGISSGQFGLIVFLNNILKLIIVIAGIFAFIQILIAGFAFITAGGDSKKISDAWSKIYMSLLGLTVVAGSFVLAAIFGYLIFGDATMILSPKIYGP